MAMHLRPAVNAPSPDATPARMGIPKPSPIPAVSALVVTIARVRVVAYLEWASGS